MGLTHPEDVEEVVVAERVEDLLDGRLGDLHALPRHGARRVQQDDDVLRERRRLDVPASRGRRERVRVEREPGADTFSRRDEVGIFTHGEVVWDN